MASEEIAPGVYSLNPLEDSRWSELVERHPAGSVFHTTSWVRALQRTYRYEPVVYTTTPPSAARLENGILMCRVDSWLTGKRLVSVPFADHCEPLVEGGERARLVDAIAAAAARERLRYAELRPASPFEDHRAAQESASYVLHRIDLRPPIDAIFRRFHPSTIQRKIRRAGRESLTVEQGRSEALLRDFYRLMLVTRRRHGLPPQSRRWFSDLADCFGENLTIAVARHEGLPIAAMLTLSHGRTLVYKYGCSEARFHSTGAMPLLFWEAARAGKALGLETFDLGRSDLGAAGLITFKDRLGGERSALRYLRYPAGRRQGAGVPERAKAIVGLLPDGFLALAGRLLYPHLG